MKTTKLITSISDSLALTFAIMLTCMRLAANAYITVPIAAKAGLIAGVADMLFTLLMFLLWVRKNIDT